MKNVVVNIASSSGPNKGKNKYKYYQVWKKSSDCKQLKSCHNKYLIFLHKMLLKSKSKYVKYTAT